MAWTEFYDLHSGGYRKESFDVAYIELPEEEAIEIFTDKFQHPYQVACACCGEDYAVHECDGPPDPPRERHTVLVLTKEDL